MYNIWGLARATTCLLMVSHLNNKESMVLLLKRGLHMHGHSAENILTWLPALKSLVKQELLDCNSHNIINVIIRDMIISNVITIKLSSPI